MQDELVPNLRLQVLRAAVAEAEEALADVSPGGGTPTHRIAEALSTGWVSEPAAGRTVADIDADGRRLHAGLLEALEHLRSLAAAEAVEPRVPVEDPRGNPAVYDTADGAP